MSKKLWISLTWSVLLYSTRKSFFIPKDQVYNQNRTLRKPRPSNVIFSRHLLMGLCERCDKLPTRLFITGAKRIDIDPIFIGGFADIYRAIHNDEVVALKRLRILLIGREREAFHHVSGRPLLCPRTINLPGINARDCIAKL
jgi:hypothetical protein